MSKRVDLFKSTYGNFTEHVLAAVRAEAFGEDMGQNSWTTVDEYDHFLASLKLGSSDHMLEIASGAGGPARYVAEKTGCRITGIDASEEGVAAANAAAKAAKMSGQVKFQVGDATEPLAFGDGSFDALMCIDSMNHFPDRASVFKEWSRVLRPGALALLTDPVVITGAVTNDELAMRSSIGLFVFVPPVITEGFIEKAGLRMIRQEDLTDNAALVSGRWHAARQKHKTDLVKIEGKERFEGLQTFFATVHRLTSEQRLSRIAWLVEKR